MTGAARGLWMSPGARVSIVALFVLTCLIGTANLLFTSSEVSHLAGIVHKQDVQAQVQDATITQLRTQQRAACGFASVIGSVPLPASPKQSKLGVSLVADSRDWWRQLGCPGTLPVPPGFARWAAYYDLPANLRR